MHDKVTHVRAAIKFLLFTAGTLLLVPVQLTYMILVWSPKHQSPIVRLWFRFVRGLLGIHLTVINKKFLSKRKKVFLGNHISYLDIIVLGAAFDCFFVAKNDVASWPIFGFLSKIGGTIFISRQRAHIKKQIPLLQKHIDDGRSLFLFPEGTTSNGRQVLGFKSSLLNVLPLTKKKPVIQPITLAYTKVNGKEMITPNDFDQAAWYGDMTLAPHLWNVFRQRSFHATIIVHHAIADYDDKTIKEITIETHDIVKNGFDKTVSF